MEKLLELLKKHIAEHPPNFGDGESVLTILLKFYFALSVLALLRPSGLISPTASRERFVSAGPISS